jgi:chromosome segregation ATPase
VGVIFQEDAAKLQRRFSELQEQMGAYERERDGLTGQIVQLRDREAALERALRLKSTDLEQEQRQTAALRGRLERINEAEREAGELKVQIAGLKREMGKLTVENERLQADLGDARVELRTASVSLNELRARMDPFELLLRALQAKLDAENAIEEELVRLGFAERE